MSKELEGAAEGPDRQSLLLSTALYKRNQGRVTRQATFGALVLVVAMGCWSLYYELGGVSQSVRAMILCVLLFGGAWLSFRAVNWPRFADFLISVEAEMSKVSWPTKTDLVRTSGVVMFTIFGLAMILYLYDVIWQSVLRGIGVLGF